MLFKILKRLPPVGAAPPLRSNLRFLAAMCLSALCVAHAEQLIPGSLSSPAYVAQIQAHSSDEVNDILNRLEALFEKEDGYPSSQPLALILHGDEARAFLRSNYEENRALVDLAARLDAFNAIDVQICETWMAKESVSSDQLPAFVDTVPYGPAAESSLIDQGWEYF